jgi:hypothetical protein
MRFFLNLLSFSPCTQRFFTPCYNDTVMANITDTRVKIISQIFFYDLVLYYRSGVIGTVAGSYVEVLNRY